MTLVLYNNAISTCSQKVRLVLAEKGLEFEDVQIDFRTSQHLSPEYLKLNPNGVVPTLVVDGEPIIDSSCIIEYLDEVYPDPPMAPRDALGRARMRAWLRYIEEVPTVAIRYPSFQNVFLERFKKLDPAEFEKAADDRPLRTGFYKRMGQGGFAQADLDNAMHELRQTVSRIDAALADGRAYILGEDVSLVDYCVTPALDRAEDLGLGLLDGPETPRARAWFDRLQARPAYAKAYYPKTRLSEFYDHLPGAKGRARGSAPAEEQPV